MADQRYVSNELTHFVGRASRDSAESTYQLLVKILREGWLTHPPHVVGPSKGRDINFNRSELADDLIEVPEMICFCDIPLADLDLHMGKYSRFGLSFSRPFLGGKGANPVFYVAANAVEAVNAVWADERTNRVAFGEDIEAWIRSGLPKQRKDDMTPLELLFWRHVLPYVKVFDDSLDHGHTKNYYMEREWRVRGNMPFTLDDIQRIIVPDRSFGKRFRVDMPDFHGQMTFADKSQTSLP